AAGLGSCGSGFSREFLPYGVPLKKLAAWSRSYKAWAQARSMDSAICDRQHTRLHANLTKLEQSRSTNAAPSRAADSREFRVTTKDPAQGRQAAPRRRIPALSLFLPFFALAAASPAFAATGLAADAADQLHVSAPLRETVAAPMLPDQRPMLLANDVSMLIDAGAGPAIIPADADGRVRTLLKRALALLGTPYRWGGSTTDGFDCSGLVGYVF